MSSEKEIQNLYLDEDVLDPFQRKKKLTESTYYKNLQKSLAQKKERLEDQHKTAKSHKQEQGNSHKPRSVFMYKPKFQWSKSDTEWQIMPKTKKDLKTTLTTFDNSTNVLVTFLGYKIDLTTQKSVILDKYAKNYIESRSPNLLLSKFAEIKTGMYQFILTLLGMSTTELKTVQKKALKTAIQETIVLFEQNEYNLEMLHLFSGGKKNKSRQKILLEIRSQHSQALAALGEEDLITKEYIVLCKQKAVRAVLEEMRQEQQAMQMLLEYPS